MAARASVNICIFWSEKKAVTRDYAHSLDHFQCSDLHHRRTELRFCTKASDLLRFIATIEYNLLFYKFLSVAYILVFVYKRLLS